LNGRIGKTVWDRERVRAGVELTTEYYAGHLKKIQRSLGNPYSVLGRHHKSLNVFIRSSLADLPEGMQILDAGCGLSIWVDLEARRRHRIVGVDCQADSINACRGLYPGEDYRLGDMYGLEFADNCFDAVVMREVIEHLRVPEDAVREALRVLKPGGRLVLTTPNYDSLVLHVIEHTYNRFFGGPCKPYRDDVHPSKLRVATLKALIERYLAIEQYAVVDWGISLVCVARKW